MGDQYLRDLARAVINSNLYMTLGTADAAGRPWVTPLYYATAGYTRFYWVSSPQAAHSRNLATRPEVSLTIFDSRTPIGAGRAVYVTAVAGELGFSDLERGIDAFSCGSRARGVREWRPEEVRPPAPHRLYRATASEFWVQDLASYPDQRTPVTV